LGESWHHELATQQPVRVHLCGLEARTLPTTAPTGTSSFTDPVNAYREELCSTVAPSKLIAHATDGSSGIPTIFYHLRQLRLRCAASERATLGADTGSVKDDVPVGGVVGQSVSLRVRKDERVQVAASRARGANFHPNNELCGARCGMPYALGRAYYWLCLSLEESHNFYWRKELFYMDSSGHCRS